MKFSPEERQRLNIAIERLVQKHKKMRKALYEQSAEPQGERRKLCLILQINASTVGKNSFQVLASKGTCTNTTMKKSQKPTKNIYANVE